MLIEKKKDGFIAWHQAALEGSLEAMEILRSWVKEAELNTDEMLLVPDADGYTAFPLAAGNNHAETRKKMWVWAEETQLNPKELKKNLFLAKDKDGFIAWHLAALNGSFSSNGDITELG
jgi:ankyrin repeat protein